MPRKPQKQEEPCERVCGNCRFMQRHEPGEEIGDCYADPPFVLHVEGEGVISARPVVASDEAACRHFSVRLNS